MGKTASFFIQQHQFKELYSNSNQNEKKNIVYFLNWEYIIQQRMLAEFWTFDKQANGKVSLSDFTYIFGGKFEPGPNADIIEHIWCLSKEQESFGWGKIDYEELIVQFVDLNYEAV